MQRQKVLLPVFNVPIRLNVEISSESRQDEVEYHVPSCTDTPDPSSGALAVFWRSIPICACAADVDSIQVQCRIH